MHSLPIDGADRNTEFLGICLCKLRDVISDHSILNFAHLLEYVFDLTLEFRKLRNDEVLRHAFLNYLEIVLDDLVELLFVNLVLIKSIQLLNDVLDPRVVLQNSVRVKDLEEISLINLLLGVEFAVQINLVEALVES